MNQGQPYYILQDELQSQFWDTLRTMRFYFEYAPCTCQHTLVKGLGLASTLFNEFGGGENLLKGAIIDGVVYGDTTFVVGIDDDPDLIPTEFKLEQNYPNPFNPRTIISWQSPVGSHQTLKVYDVLGREVATPVNEYKDAGSYEIEFDGTHLASGIYYYQLKVGEFVEIRKMILIK
ncbi:MAG: T9SS type A sorting domain-containing protein [Ignavibacteriales bacterium]|nr:MAG: T9SS type A sorting domain-containing protein [Ignavibacteriales bacterium]